jgi:phage tail tape-measure protein
MTDKLDDNPENRDPITKEPGSHPVGTGVGAAGGAAGGAAIGAAVGGPVGAVVGGAVGAIAGGAAGHAAGEAKPYEEYEPAYRYGWESASRPEYRGRKFNEVENDLEKGWDRAKGATGRAWYDVKDATRDAYDRVRH